MNPMTEPDRPSDQPPPQVVAQLMHEFPDVPRQRIETELQQAMAELQINARVTTFIPVLAVRRVRLRIRNGGEDAA